MAGQANSLLTVLPPKAEEAPADDLTFDFVQDDDEGAPVAAAASLTAASSAAATASAAAADTPQRGRSRQAPPEIAVDDVLHIGGEEDSESGDSVKSADLLQLIQQASEAELSSEPGDDAPQATGMRSTSEPEPAPSTPSPAVMATAEIRDEAATALASSAALRADEGRSSAPAEQAAFHWSAAAAAAPALQAEDEQDGLAELEVQSAPSRGSAAIEATFGVGGVAGFVAAANEAPGELVMLAGQAAAHHQEEAPRENAIDEMFADILGPIQEPPPASRAAEATHQPAAAAPKPKAASDASAGSSYKRVMAAELGGPPRRGQAESAESSKRSLAVPAVSKLANLMQESTERREIVPQNNSPGNSSVCNREAEEEDATLDKEWDEIARRTDELIANARETKGVVATSQDVLSQPLSYKEFTQWLLQLEIDPAALRQMREEMVEDDPGNCVGCFLKRRRPLSEVPGLDRRFWADKDLVLFLKVTHFDFNDVVHHRMLRTMYGKLSRNKVCPSIGKHWELLGFQSGDPRTDLNRSGGVLNVMQMFYFFSHHFDLMKSAYLLAQDAQHNFPLACVSINITKMVIECLLEGRLSKLCNGSRGVFDTTCMVYSAAFFHWYWRWRTQKRTIGDTELTFKEVRALLERRPAKLLDMLQQGIAESKAKTDPSRLEFTDIDFGGARGAAKGNQAVPDKLQRYQYDE